MIAGAFFCVHFLLCCYLGNHGESKHVADAADNSDEDLSAVTLP